VVASDIPGYRAALGDAGILVPPGEAESLAEALGRLLADDELRSTLAAAGVARAHELSIDRLADRYAELYEVAATT
jgi:glycosyltransferase involved in cell wall biosynthesis